MQSPKFDNNTLNIFTDASIVEIGYGDYISCSGAVAYTGPLDNLSIVDEIFQINVDSTNNNGEIIAILKGLELALKHRDEFSSLNLFSDSKICIYGLREWIQNWVTKVKDDGILIGSQGTPIKNQDEIVQCIDLIINNELPIKLYHQRGHQSDKTLQNSLQTFKKSNYIANYIPNELIMVLNRNNNYVDCKSRDILQEKYKEGLIDTKSKINLVSRSYIYNTNIDIDKYLNLVNN